MSEQENDGVFREMMREFRPIMDGFVRARNPLELKFNVLHRHVERSQQYKQLLVEAAAKADALEDVELAARTKQIEKKKLERKLAAEQDELEQEMIRIEIEGADTQLRRMGVAAKGALAEIVDFYRIMKADYADFIGMSEEDLNAKCELPFWISRFAHQISDDLLTDGRMSIGNRKCIQQYPLEVQKEILIQSALVTEDRKRYEEAVAHEALTIAAQSYPRKTSLLHSSAHEHPLLLRKDAPVGYPRIMDIDRPDIVIATLHRPNEKDWPGREQYISAGKNYVTFELPCPSPDLIGEYRNKLVQDALSIGAEWIFFVDDDLLVGNDALQRLFAHQLDVVGFWYNRKTPVPECASMVRVGESCGPAPDTGRLVKIDWSLAAGGMLCRMDVFKQMPYPWFFTSQKGTEDTYFCARLREHGIDAWLDTTIKAGHLDRSTGRVY